MGRAGSGKRQSSLAWRQDDGLARVLIKWDLFGHLAGARTRGPVCVHRFFHLVGRPSCEAAAHSLPPSDRTRVRLGGQSSI
jgi:hypothetical protein